LAFDKRQDTRNCHTEGAQDGDGYVMAVGRDRTSASLLETKRCLGSDVLATHSAKNNEVCREQYLAKQGGVRSKLKVVEGSMHVLVVRADVVIQSVAFFEFGEARNIGSILRLPEADTDGGRRSGLVNLEMVGSYFSQLVECCRLHGLAVIESNVHIVDHAAVFV